MNLQSSFVENLRQAEDEYEVIALCYNKLLEYTCDTDVCFVAKVGHLENDVELKQLKQQLEELRQTVISSAQEINVHFGLDGMGFDAFKENLVVALTSFKCPEEINTDRCLSVCLLYVLEALDDYVDKNLDLVRSHYRTFGPLNQARSQTGCLVYLQERESLLSTSYAEGRIGFRKPLRSTRIGNLFHAILLVPRALFAKKSIVPHITPLFLNGHCKQSLKDSKAIKIASIPYIGFPTFSFHEIYSPDPCDRNCVPKGPFYVNYNKQDQDDVQRVIALLKSAIAENANIVVFPEFIMNPRMLKGVQDSLKELEPAQKSGLLLVLAGTCYHWDRNEQKGDNVLHILNANGVEICSYYKHSPFLVQAEEKIHGAFLQPKGKTGLQIQLEQEKSTDEQRVYLENCEILSNPGKECTLVDVEVVGRILPAICRDAIDGETGFFSELFVPSFLMVPAWSPSITSFESEFSKLANNIHTVSLLCNCCNAVEGDNETVIGKITVPQKQGTKMSALPEEITRERDCLRFCSGRGGCTILIEIDFKNINPQVKWNKLFQRQCIMAVPVK